MALITIIKNNIKKTCVVTEGTTVLNMLIENGEKIYSPCGGNGTCGKCYVGVEGNVSEPCDVEIANCPNGVRLACKTIILGDATVFLENSKMEVCTSVEDSQIEIDPIVKNENDNYGIAIDIGTTTVAMYLCDCNTGSIVGVKGFSNPQSSFGADVISRMDKIIKDNSSLNLQKNAVLTEINSAILELSNTNNIDISSIHSAVICGNTVMQHIFAGIDPSTIAVAPFEAKTLFENGHYKASDLGLNINLNGTCLLAPCVASYVGGDITAGAFLSMVWNR
ncbi:MAG: hypothetical protein MJ236_03055, partial [Clostridia bacterium]|nr:hypothetical protein [Clostridia bacterium]